MSFEIGSFWEGLSETVSETWDVVYDTASEIVTETVQSVKESGKDTETLRAKEPVKGKRADGSPIVVSPTSNQSDQQYVTGVDNTVVIVGGVVVAIVVLVLFGRGGK